MTPAHLCRTLAAAAFLSVAGGSAFATTATFSYTFTDGSVLSGTLQGVDNGDGSYTAISGTANLSGATDLAADGALTLAANPNAPSGTMDSFSTAFTYDDLFSAGTPSFTDFGLLFTNAAVEINLWGATELDGYDLDTASSFGGVTATKSSFTITAVPEPMSLSLLVMGIVGLGVTRFRGSRTSQA